MASRTLYPVSVESIQPAFVKAYDTTSGSITPKTIEDGRKIAQAEADSHAALALKYQRQIAGTEEIPEGQKKPDITDVVAEKQMVDYLLYQPYDSKIDFNMDYWKQKEYEISETKCTLYFKLSKFNQNLISEEKLGTAQVTVTDAEGTSVVNLVDDTNFNTVTTQALLPYHKSEHYTATGTILDLPISYDEKTDLCSIEITSKDLIETHFAVDMPYKFQIRLCENGNSYQEIINKTGPEDAPISEAAYLNMYGPLFSEWSTITVARCIGSPNFIINEESGGKEDKKVDVYYVLAATFNCNQYIEYEEEGETKKEAIVSSLEKLKNYQVTIAKGEEIIVETEPIYTETFTDPNEIYYECEYELKYDTEYTVRISFETESNYIADKDSGRATEFTITTKSEPTTTDFTFTILDDLLGYDEDEACVSFEVGYKGTLPDKYEYTLMRAISPNGTKAHKWETLTTLNKLGKFQDLSIESGLYYDYAIKYEDKFSIFNVKVRRDFSYEYLLGRNNQQLKIPFDNKVSSYKINVVDQITTTIGSPYPYVDRVNNIYYRTFPISGVITIHMDEAHNFIGCDEFIADALTSDKDSYSKTTYQDRLTEREFRKIVMNFLCDGKPKLYKSEAEGNILIRLTEVNFAPMQQLGRLIYSFSANALEIAEATTKKMKTKNININPIRECTVTSASEFHKEINVNHITNGGH